MVSEYLIPSLKMLSDVIQEEIINLKKSDIIKKMVVFICFNIFICLTYVFILLVFIGNLKNGVIVAIYSNLFFFRLISLGQY